MLRFGHLETIKTCPLGEKSKEERKGCGKRNKRGRKGKEEEEKRGGNRGERKGGRGGKRKKEARKGERRERKLEREKYFIWNKYK